jgi:RNA polymerase sigma factor (sigma-70 family)
LKALKGIGGFTWQGRDFAAWLVTIARNLAVDHFKCGAGRNEVVTCDPQGVDEFDRSPEGSPESAVVEHLSNVELLAAVKQLNPEQQECIVYRFLKGYSTAETASAMGKNEGSVKALQYRATRALARLIDLADPDDPSEGFVAVEPRGRAEYVPAAWVPGLPPVEVADEEPPSRPRATGVDWSHRAIRQWARASGIGVSDRGYLPQQVCRRYAAEMAGAR